MHGGDETARLRVLMLRHARGEPALVTAERMAQDVYAGMSGSLWSSASAGSSWMVMLIRRMKEAPSETPTADGESGPLHSMSKSREKGRGMRWGGRGCTRGECVRDAVG